jgi:hypothetical protein
MIHGRTRSLCCEFDYVASLTDYSSSNKGNELESFFLFLPFSSPLFFAFIYPAIANK